MENNYPSELEVPIDTPRPDAGLPNLLDGEIEELEVPIDVPRETYDSGAGTISFEEDLNFIGPIRQETDVSQDVGVETESNFLPSHGVSGGYDNYEEAGFDSYADYADASMAEGMGGTYDKETGTITFIEDPKFIGPFMQETDVSQDVGVETESNFLPSHGVSGGYDNYEEAGFDSYADYAGASMAEGIGGTYDKETGTITFIEDPKFIGPFMQENEQFDSDLTDDLIQNLKKLIGEKGDKLSIVANLYTKFEQLNLDTKKYLQERHSYTGEDIRGYLINCVNDWFASLDSIKTQVQHIKEGLIAADKNGTGAPEKPTYNPIINSSSSSSSSSSGGSSSSGSSNVSDIEPGIGNTNISLLSAIVGIVTFVEIIPLYSEIGNKTSINSSTDGNYGLIGIIQKDGKYYYKLIDTKTNKTYYTEITDKAKLQTNLTELVEMKEPAMMLNSTEIGSNNFIKLADTGTLLFVQDKLENNGITFAEVLDYSNGKSYYIPVGDEINIVPLDTIISNMTGSK